MRTRAQYNHRAIIVACDNAAVVKRLQANPLAKRGADAMHRIAMMHAANNYDAGLTWQYACDAVRDLPTPAIDWLVADYLGDHETIPAAQLARELDAMREVR